jgi:hypothetical protein
MSTVDVVGRPSMPSSRQPPKPLCMSLCEAAHEQRIPRAFQAILATSIVAEAARAGCALIKTKRVSSVQVAQLECGSIEKTSSFIPMCATLPASTRGKPPTGMPEKHVSAVGVAALNWYCSAALHPHGTPLPSSSAGLARARQNPLNLLGSSLHAAMPPHRQQRGRPRRPRHTGAQVFA